MLPVRSVAAAERPVVLLVEDDDAVRRSLQLLLVSRGYDVRAFRSGAGVVDALEALRPQCLVVDLLIPDGDGVTLLEEVRAAGWSGPSILISGHLTDERAARAREAGFDAVLPKPIGDKILVDSIDRLVDGHAPPRIDPR